MPHLGTPRRKRATTAPLIALAATLVASTLGLAACGGSSSTTTQTSANAAASAATSTDTTAATGTTPAGTSSTGSPGVPPGGRPNPARFTAIRACLAKKGITLPQRTPGAHGLPGGTPGAPGLPGGGAQQLPKGMTRAQFTEALESCGDSGFAGGRFGRGGFRARHAFDSPRFHAVLESFATCMRQNGINVGEPNTSGKGPVFDTKGINTGSLRFRDASLKCRSAFFKSVPHRASPGAAGSATG
jgi:hypothetical protein